MQLKKLAACSLISVILLTNSNVCFGEAFTDPDAFAKSIKLGLDYATATADAKDAKEGGKAVLQKEFDDWTWKYVIGNYEKLITQNAEAELPDFKGKIDKVKVVIEKIQEVSTAVGMGKYDDALIGTTDAIVNTVDHPVISTLWAAVKLTYESHKLVKETGAELQIEALYGALENDRRLRGSSDGDGPKLFNLNTETVDYFFNKYLITNDNTREMMKAYVKVRLGEEFPERSYWQSFTDLMSVGSGVDNERSHEVAQLKEFETTSKRWVMELLKDMNKQAKVRWAQVRIAQEKAEFEKFVAKFSMFESSMPRLLKEFKEMKEFTRQSKEFPKFIEESKKERAKAEDAYSKLTATKIKEKKELYNLADKWQLNCLNFGSKASLIGEKSLSENLMGEWKAWNVLKDKIGKDFQASDPGDIVQQTAVETLRPPDGSSYQSDMNGAIQSYFNSHFKDLIVPYPWPEEPEKVKQEYLNAINTGVPGDKLWKIKQKLNWGEYTCRGDDCPDIDDSDQYFYKISQQLNKIAQENPRSDFDWWYDREGRRHPGCTVLTGAGLGCSVYYALEAANKALNNLKELQESEFQDAKKYMENLDNSFAELAKARRAQLEEIKTGLAKFSGTLPIPPDDAGSNWEPNVISYMKYEIDYIKPYTHIAIGKMYEPETDNLGMLSFRLSYEAKMLKDRAAMLENYQDGFRFEIESQTKIWEKAVIEWNEFYQKLNLDENDYIQLRYFADRNFTKESIDKYVKAANAVSYYTSTAKGIYESFRSTSNTEINNIMTDADYLESIKTEWDKWLDKQIKNGILTNYYGNIYPAPRKNSDGYCLVDKPYEHYLTQEDFSSYFDPVTKEMKTLKVYALAEHYLPLAYTNMNDLMKKFSDYRPAKEANFIHPIAKVPVWKSDIEKAKTILNSIKVDDNQYLDKMTEVSKILPYTLRMGTDTERRNEEQMATLLGKPLPPPVNRWLGELRPLDENLLNKFAIGNEFLSLRTKIKSILEEREKYLNRPAPPPPKPENPQLKELLQQISDFLSSINKTGSTNVNLVADYYSKLANFKIAYDRIGQNDAGIDAALEALTAKINTLSEMASQEENASTNKVRDFYNEFRQAYEGKNASLLVSMISDDWEAVDGTTLSDVETNFSRIFSMFDDIRFNITNLNIIIAGQNLYNISYDVEITAENYEQALKHQEKSTVSEQVAVQNGKVKILRTIRGRYWDI